jgi:hypothetical protein
MNTNNNLTDAELQIAIANFSNGASRFEEDEKRGVRDQRTGRFIQHADYGADTKLNVQFSVEPVLSKLETYLAGGIPKYVDMDFITITIPGDNGLVIHTPVTDFYEWRFPNEYENFKKGQDAAVTGTPLSLWPAMQPAQIAELKHHGIRTIEQLAELSDSSAGVMRGFYQMKTKAKQFLEDAKDKNATAVVRVQMEEQAERHAAEMKAMEDRFTAMLAQVIPKEKKAKPSEDLG